jgi:hypothetical protein
VVERNPGKDAAVKSMLTFAAAAVLGLSGAAQAAMTKAELKTEKERIEKEYEAAKDKCKSHSGNAKDICVAEAKGYNKVALAELDERNEPSANSRQKVKVVKAEAEYEVAREKCDDRAGDAKDACVKEARAALARDKVNAKQ